MKNNEHEKITGNNPGIKIFTTSELSFKIYGYLMNHNETADRINEFTDESFDRFEKSLKFNLGRSMVKHSSPKQIIEWNIAAKDSGTMSDKDNEESSIETISIVNDYLTAKSKEAMKRIIDCHDEDFGREILTNAQRYDYSIVCPKNQFDDYESVLFSKENQEYVISYYLEYLNIFPVTLSEFEKIFFYYLTLIIKDDFIDSTELDYTDKYKMKINNVLKMRYIDINDRLILTLLYIITLDEELQRSCNNIYRDIKNQHDATIIQFMNISS